MQNLTIFKKYYSFRSVQPLRVDTVLRALQGVKDWKRLGESLIGCTNPKLIEIQTQSRSSVDRLRAVVEHWLQNGGRPSWRVIMWALDWAEESQLADPIRDYAEPPRGESSNCYDLCSSKNILAASANESFEFFVMADGSDNGA